MQDENVLNNTMEIIVSTQYQVIGKGTITDMSLPIEPYYGFSYTQSIYLKSEIGGSANRPDSPEVQRAARAKAAGIVQTLLAQNLIVREKGSLKTSASYKSGKVIVNGRKINVTDLLNSPLLN